MFLTEMEDQLCLEFGGIREQLHPQENQQSIKESKMSNFEKELKNLINSHCRENESNTPDFLLAEYLYSCLDAYEKVTKARDKWYSVHLEPINPQFTN